MKTSFHAFARFAYILLVSGSLRLVTFDSGIHA